MFNSIYAQTDIVKQMRAHYLAGGKMLYLPNFFSDSGYGSLLTVLRRSTGEKTRVADRYSYTPLRIEILEKLLSSREFLKLMQMISGKKIKKSIVSVRRFGHGDFTLIHDSERNGARLEFRFLLMERWHTLNGGHIVYTSMKREPLLMPLQGNGLLLIDKPTDMHSFVQYINHKAGKENFVLATGYFE